MKSTDGYVREKYQWFEAVSQFHFPEPYSLCEATHRGYPILVGINRITLMKENCHPYDLQIDFSRLSNTMRTIGQLLLQIDDSSPDSTSIPKQVSNQIHSWRIACNTSNTSPSPNRFQKTVIILLHPNIDASPSKGHHHNNHCFFLPTLSLSAPLLSPTACHFASFS